MENLPLSNPKSFRLKFSGKMTYEHYDELEARAIDAMRRHKSLEIDLADVKEIDICGLHLIVLLQSVGAVVATSPVVEQASKRLLVTLHATALGRAARREKISSLFTESEM